MNNSTKLKNMLHSGTTLVVPDAYDPLSAMLIEQAGFAAVQCSGFSMAIAAGGRSESELGLKYNLSVTRSIVQAVQIPVMADGEDGFGDVDATIRAYVQAGVSGINLEDQIAGTGKVNIREDAVANIRAARKSALETGNPKLIINARTDALPAGESRASGLREAITRGNRFLEAGADLVFVTKVATLEEVKTLVKEVNGPVSIAAGLAYNINNFSVRELCDCGVARVSLPSFAIQSAVAALKRNLQVLKDTGEFTELQAADFLCSRDQLISLRKG